MQPLQWEGPLFVIGMPRSGTKLLKKLLNRHPRISILPWETEFLPFIVRWVDRHGEPRTAHEFERLADTLQKALYFDYRRKVRGPFSWQEWRAACRERFDAAGLFDGFARAELGLEPGSGTIWGDKSPGYIGHVEMLGRLYPNAKIIHIVRDVRDYCLSLHETFGKDMRRAAHRWNAAMTHMQTLLARNTPGLVSVRYEALVTAPAIELARLCRHLEVDYSDAMLALDEPVENHGSTKGRTGIVATNFGRWRQKLTPRMVREVESIAWHGMHAMGYTPELATAPRQLGELTLTVLRAKDGVRLITRDVENRGLLGSAAAYVGDYLIKRRSEVAP